MVTGNGRKRLAVIAASKSSTGTEKRSGAVLRLLSRTASGAEHRLQPQSFRNRGLPGRRTVRLTPLNASSHRFFLFCPATNHTPHATQKLNTSSHRFFLFWGRTDG